MCATDGLYSSRKKAIRAPCEGKPHARCDEGAVETGPMEYLMRHPSNRKGRETRRGFLKVWRHCSTLPRRLAQQLRAGTLEAIHIPSGEDEAVRDYLRARGDVRLELKKTKPRIHRFLLRHGYVYDSTRYWTLRHDQWLRSLEFERSMLKETFDEYYFMMKGLTEKLRLMDKRIEEIAMSEPYAERVQRLRCLKGIDYLTALSIVCEVGDFRRFGHAEAFMAYLGLVPREYSSGEKRRQGSITKAGNTHLRNLLIESSWHYRYRSAPSKRLTERREGQSAEIIAYADRAMRRLQGKFFRLILKGKTKQATVTAVARELAGFVWGIMVGQTA